MSLCGDVDAAGIRMPLHRFAGTIRRNKHRDDRAHGRLQNPLAQNDVRAGEPSRRWEARWNKWKGQASIDDNAVEPSEVLLDRGARVKRIRQQRFRSGRLFQQRQYYFLPEDETGALYLSVVVRALDYLVIPNLARPTTATF